MQLPNNHLKGCPQKDDQNDECMCDYIKEHRPKKKHSMRATCPSSIKKLALEAAELASFGGHNKFERVSKKFLDACERNAHEFIRHRVATHGLHGRKTLM